MQVTAHTQRPTYIDDCIHGAQTTGHLSAVAQKREPLIVVLSSKTIPIPDDARALQTVAGPLTGLRPSSCQPRASIKEARMGMTREAASCETHYTEVCRAMPPHAMRTKSITEQVWSSSHEPAL